MVNHGALAATEAVQLVPALAVTVAVPVCAGADIEAGLGANGTIETTGVVPACVTFNVAGVKPAAVIVIVPNRLDVAPFACAEKVSVTLPEPPEPPLGIVSQAALLLDVQLVTPLAVTVAVPFCAVPTIDTVGGVMVNVGVVPACVTVNVAAVAPVALIVIVPCRLAEPALACAE